MADEEKSGNPEVLNRLPEPLLAWYGTHARTLPWRSDPTPYHVLLSEIMLQQTRVTAVLEYYDRFLEACPTVADLAALPEDRLMKLWQGLGYYNRARNLQAAARQIMERFGGEFPRDYESVRSLKGVGDYTAGAVCSIAFGLPVPAVDGNVLRVVARITGDEGDITAADTKARVTQRLAGIIPEDDASRFTQAMMELGALVCLPRGAPRCAQCPAADFCAARAQGRTEVLPVKGKRKARRVEERTVWLLFCRGKVALRRRPDRGLLAGLWEYPSEPGPDWPREWGPEPEDARPGGTATHVFTHIEWHMTARTAGWPGGTLPPGWVWADGAELERVYAVPGAFSAFAPLVEAGLRQEGGAP